MKDGLTKNLAKHLQSALRWIAREFEDRFVDDMGEELPREDGGNFSLTSFDADFGDYTFDFRDAEKVLNRAGFTVEKE
jgi:hypothetical protein